MKIDDYNVPSNRYVPDANSISVTLLVDNTFSTPSPSGVAILKSIGKRTTAVELAGIVMFHTNFPSALFHSLFISPLTEL